MNLSPAPVGVTIDNRSFVLHVDADSRIFHVNEAWLAFGRENDLPMERGLLGRRLFEFISDTTTQQLYRTLLAHVSKFGRTVTFPFRCDSPALRRFMEMQMSPLAGKGIEFRSRIVKAEVRPRVELLAPAAPRSEELIHCCGWCKRVSIPEWVEIEEGLQRMKWLEEPRLPDITHGICPPCEARMMAEIASFKPA